jgi:hypothetical protein
VSIAEYIFILDNAVKIPKPFIVVSRGGSGGRVRALIRAGGRAFSLIRVGRLSAQLRWGTARRLDYIHKRDAMIYLDSRPEEDSAFLPLSRINDSIFRGRRLPTLKHGLNVAISPRCPPRVDTHYEYIVSVREGHSFKSHSPRDNIGAIFKRTGVPSLSPLHSIKQNHYEGKNSQNYLGAVIQPPGKTIFGYVLTLFGLVMKYFGFCALYKGWYRLTHGLQRGRLGLCLGLLFIAASVFVLCQGFYLIL